MVFPSASGAGPVCSRAIPHGQPGATEDIPERSTLCSEIAETSLYWEIEAQGGRRFRRWIGR